MQYKILFVGLGSIGNRHLINAISILNSHNVSFLIDALRTKNTQHESINTIYTAFEDVPTDYDIIFITTPTHLHYEAIRKLQNKTKHFFIEKPIFEKNYNINFALGINYVACPLRFHPTIKELREYAKNNTIYSYRAICSTYLPDWRKDDYRKCYSAIKDQGGGVELDLIHEIDYIKWIFGYPKKTYMMSSKKSNLEITSNDIAVYLFEHEKVLGSLHLDYFGKTPKREIEVFSDTETRVFNVLENKLNEDMYINEMSYFFDLVEKKPKTYYNAPSEALESIKIALTGDAEK